MDKESQKTVAADRSYHTTHYELAYALKNSGEMLSSSIKVNERCAHAITNDSPFRLR